MVTATRHKVEYTPLARLLAMLPMDSTCGDLTTLLATYQANDAAYWQTVLASLRELPAEEEWLVGLFRLCELLKADNPRFAAAILMDAVLERV